VEVTTMDVVEIFSVPFTTSEFVSTTPVPGNNLKSAKMNSKMGNESGRTVDLNRTSRDPLKTITVILDGRARKRL